jgi:hypothetical protein
VPAASLFTIWISRFKRNPENTVVAWRAAMAALNTKETTCKWARQPLPHLSTRDGGIDVAGEMQLLALVHVVGGLSAVSLAESAGQA